MKIRTVIPFIIAIVLNSCAPSMPMQEIEGIASTPTTASFTETAIAPELGSTLEPNATASLTQVPSTTPPSCVSLLTPPNGVEIPAIGKVTFSWNSLPEAMFYVLIIVLPSGATASFDTKVTFRGQYMEAFPAGGQYQWKVIAQDRKRNEICSSELATFSKPASNLPNQPLNEDSKK